MGNRTLDWTKYNQRRNRLISSAPKIGMVVGTYAAVPYVHLHLETRRRLYPEIPLLVHDDCSRRAGELEKLCADYGADFVSTVTRLGQGNGDLSAIAAGFDWARGHSLDVLVKMSRRFLPLKPWTADFAALVTASDYATYSSWTTSFDFGFRTECIGFAVAEWFELGLVQEIVDQACADEAPFVEGFMHNLARLAAIRRSQAARDYDAKVGARPASRDGYAVWPFLGTDRCARGDQFLWHDWASSEDYAAQARAFGLAYQAEDFGDLDE